MYSHINGSKYISLSTKSSQKPYQILSGGMQDLHANEECLIQCDVFCYDTIR